MISKPVVPPWNDSSKNLVRDLASAMRRHTPVVMQPRGETHALGQAELAEVYAAGGGRFAPAASAQARVLLRLLASRDEPIFHFFFAPNLKTSTVGRVAAALRRRRAVHTVCSAPRDVRSLDRTLFADRTVVLSHQTEARFLEAGVPRARLLRIPPSVPPLEPLSPAARAEVRARLAVPEGVPLFVYAGDLEMGGGAERVVTAALAHPGELVVVMACRQKTADAARVDAALRARVARAGAEARFRFVGETEGILPLVGAADALLLPSTDLYAKMDYPLVVLEAMALGRPAVVAEGTPAAELAALGGVVAVKDGAGPLAGAFAALAASPAYREDLGARAREVARASFAPSAMAEAYESLYDGLA
jgi:glycosyltransferase involved in cell wall biosynthesis